MEVIILLINGILNLICFFIGFKIGRIENVQNKEISFNIPKIKNPKQIVQDKQRKEDIEKEERRLQTIIRNIENYDGTDNGQEDIPN